VSRTPGLGAMRFGSGPSRAYVAVVRSVRLGVLYLTLFLINSECGVVLEDSMLAPRDSYSWNASRSQLGALRLLLSRSIRRWIRPVWRSRSPSLQECPGHGLLEQIERVSRSLPSTIGLKGDGRSKKPLKTGSISPLTKRQLLSSFC
jgi:hypothetical protein